MGGAGILLLGRWDGGHGERAGYCSISSNGGVGCTWWLLNWRGGEREGGVEGYAQDFWGLLSRELGVLAGDTGLVIELFGPRCEEGH